MKKRLVTILVTILVLLLVAYLGAGNYLYNQLAFIDPPNVDSRPNTPANFKITFEGYADFDPTPYFMENYEDVSFPSRDEDITLRGWYVETDPAAPVVILTHGLKASRREANILTPAGMLARNGFNVLIYDLRNHGDSDHDNGRTSIGNKEYKDVLGAWDWLIEEKGYSPERIGLYGISLGGGTTLIAFGEEPRVAAAFVDSPFANLPEIITAELQRNNYPTILAPSGIFMARVMDGTDLLAHSPADAVLNDNGRPLFIIHGTADSRISVDQTRELETLAQQNNANLIVWIPEGVEHVGAVFDLPQEYEQRLVEFFRAALK